MERARVSKRAKRSNALSATHPVLDGKQTSNCIVMASTLFVAFVRSPLTGKKTIGPTWALAPKRLLKLHPH